MFSQWNWGEPVMLLEPEEDFLNYTSWHYEALDNASHILDKFANPPYSRLKGMGLITPGILLHLTSLAIIFMQHLTTPLINRL